MADIRDLVDDSLVLLIGHDLRGWYLERPELDYKVTKLARSCVTCVMRFAYFMDRLHAALTGITEGARALQSFAALPKGTGGRWAKKAGEAWRNGSIEPFTDSIELVKIGIKEDLPVKAPDAAATEFFSCDVDVTDPLRLQKRAYVDVITASDLAKFYPFVAPGQSPKAGEDPDLHLKRAKDQLNAIATPTVEYEKRVEQGHKQAKHYIDHAQTVVNSLKQYDSVLVQRAYSVHGSAERGRILVNYLGEILGAAGEVQSPEVPKDLPKRAFQTREDFLTASTDAADKLQQLKKASSRVRNLGTPELCSINSYNEQIYQHSQNNGKAIEINQKYFIPAQAAVVACVEKELLELENHFTSARGADTAKLEKRIEDYSVHGLPNIASNFQKRFHRITSSSVT